MSVIRREDKEIFITCRFWGCCLGPLSEVFWPYISQAGPAAGGTLKKLSFKLTVRWCGSVSNLTAEEVSVAQAPLDRFRPIRPGRQEAQIRNKLLAGLPKHGAYGAFVLAQQWPGQELAICRSGAPAGSVQYDLLADRTFTA